ncbi:substrate-binding domain-containing protein [Dactylosporangium sp. NPDC051541]|uniref:substrate-binding domain-containing protein n=1 Tax=Dactylosporangium sp. NPDC051541 TaxID=3363977 RepID=UPI00379187ED
MPEERTIRRGGRGGTLPPDRVQPEHVRTRTIGVITRDRTVHGAAAALRGIERAARMGGYSLRVETLRRADQHTVAAAFATLARQSVTGVIAAAALPPTALLRLPADLPVVAVQPDAAGIIPAVVVDQAAGARAAVAHLLGLGHEQVWHVSGAEDWPETHSRVAGWRAAHRAFRRMAPPVLEGDWTARSGYAAGLRLAHRPDVTAVFAASDQMALGLLRAFAERGILVPGDISVVGFDDIPEAAYLHPPLTTIRQNHDEIGRRCVTALLEFLAVTGHAGLIGQEADGSLRPRLVLRDTTGPAAAARAGHEEHCSPV